MFGKPEWFKRSSFGWGLTPVTREGWMYHVAWAVVFSLPAIGLVVFDRWLEGGIWMIAMTGFLFFDLKSIRNAMQRQVEEKEVLRIMDEEETRQESAETGKFAMHVSDSQVDVR